MSCAVSRCGRMGMENVAGRRFCSHHASAVRSKLSSRGFSSGQSDGLGSNDVLDPGLFASVLSSISESGGSSDFGSSSPESYGVSDSGASSFDGGSVGGD